jgi:transcriptional regulator with GAF, ATPase, and Fis domain
MEAENRIDMDIFKIVTRAVTESDDLIDMTTHICQLLVATLQIKACTVFVMNLDTEELEILATFGLSTTYLGKGPVRADKSIGCTLKGETVIVRDIGVSDRLQYPEHARSEGIAAIVSVPIIFTNEVIGALRLYHYEPWDISASDVDSLLILSENIGLAMMYTRLFNSLRRISGELENLPQEIKLH